MNVPTKIKIGSWTTSPALNLLESGERSLKLEPRTMDVLVCLAARAGEVVPVGDLLATVWRGVVVSDHSVYIAIKQLRKAFATVANDTSYIETIPKRGYRLVAPVENLGAAPRPGEGAAHRAPVPRTGRRLVAARVGLALIAAVAALYVLWPGAPHRGAPAVAERPASPIRFSVAAPGSVYGLALSADGQRLAYTAGASPATALLYVRHLSALESRPLAGTEGAQQPFWSPDGEHVGFAVPAQGWLRRVALVGGPPRNVARTPVAGGAVWTDDDVIVFDGGAGIQRVPASGGEQVKVTALEGTDVAHAFPSVLPGGTRFLFAAAFGAPSVYAQSLDSAERVRVLPEASTAVYASGHLLFNRGSMLLAQPFDSERLAPLGEPILVADGIATLGTFGSFTVAQNGVLAFVVDERDTALRMQRSRLAWYDRQGQRLGTVGEPGLYRGVALAPDGKRIAVHLHEEPAGGNIWVFDADREIFTPLTFGERHDVSPIWSRDGDEIVFAADLASVYRKRANGTGVEELVLGPLRAPFPTDWSPDGATVLLAHTPANHWQVSALPLATHQAHVPLLGSGSGLVGGARFSPDGRWIAYISNESGSFEVYVAAYPETGTKWRISDAGGGYPRWSSNGGEIFYVAADGTLMAVAVASGDGALQHEKPQALFRADFMLGDHNLFADDFGFGELPHHPFDVSADGRVLVNERFDSTAESDRHPHRSSITVVVDWLADRGS